MHPRRGLVPLLLAGLLLVGCGTTDAADTAVAASGNMVSTSAIAPPKHQEWFSGQLAVEPAGAGRACLLLRTDDASYVLRSASDTLEVVAWQRDGAFDATRSGIVRGTRLVAPYGDEQISVRGQVVAPADGTCSTHPTLAVARAARGDRVPPSATPEVEETAAPDPAAGGTGPVHLEPPLTTMSGTLGVVRGNQREGYCLSIETAAGAYTLGSSSKAYDVVVSEIEDGVDTRRTGIHHHGRNALGMYATVGQHVELVGRLYGDNTGFRCSRYYQFALTDVVP